MSETATQHIGTPSPSLSQKERNLDGWREVNLGEVATFSQGIQVSINMQKSEPFSNSVRFIRIVDFTKKDISELRYIENPGQKYLVNEDDLVMIRYGSQTAGKIARGFKGAIANNTFKIVVNGDFLDRDFIFYGLSQKSVYNYFSVSQSSSTMPAITFGMISDLEFPLPPLPEQKAIAEVLSSLDDKIDLLHRQNKTLEDMAQALFRKWFVEEPNENWEEKPLDKIADYLNGLACQKYPPKNEIDKLPVLKIKELRNGFTENSDWATSEVADKYIIELGDVVFSWSGSLMLKIWDGKKCVLNQHLFKVTSEKYPKWFYYFWTKHHIEKFIAIADSKATTMGHIKRTDLSNSMALIPKNRELLKMNDRIESQFERIILNYRQISNLENLRDTLLPKLMSGAVRVRF